MSKCFVLPVLHTDHMEILDLECYDMFSRSPLYFQFVISPIPCQSMYELFFSHMLCKTKHAYITTGMVSSFKSIFLVSIPHLAFHPPKAHLIGFLADLNILFKRLKKKLKKNY